MKCREEQPDDQENIQKATKLLLELINLNDIHDTIWTSAMGYIIAQSFRNSEIPYEKYCIEMDRFKKFYKFLWENPKSD